MTWKAVDDCGNESATVSQTISVVDETAPVITLHCPPVQTIVCPAQPIFHSPTATDNCDPAPEIVVVSDITTPGACAGAYTRTITWKAVDDCGNESAPVSETIIVIDNVAPVISAAGDDATIACPGEPEFTAPTATDNCDPNPEIVLVSDVTTPGECPGAYIRTRTWMAIDDCGNASGNVSQSITVIDETAPVISAAGNDATIECTESPVFTAPTATDDCDPAPDVILVSDVTEDGECPGTYTRTKTWRAVDACGNESGTVSQTITVIDQTAPVISAAGDDAEISCPGSPVFTAPTATDNCDPNPEIILVS
jgi:hypothetical protein